MSEDKGEELMEKADKRLKGGFSFFSGTAKFEDAVEMYTKAGNSFKIVKKCMLSHTFYATHKRQSQRKI
jgi:alpha-soluble NSF attachment protein